MPSRLVAQRLPWSDPVAIFTGGLGAQQHAFWLDAGPDADAGFSWMGIGAPADHPPADVLLATSPNDRAYATDPTDAASIPGPFHGGWVGWSGYDTAAAAAGAPARVEDADGPPHVWLRTDWFLTIDHAARRMWLVGPLASMAEARERVAGWVAASRAASAAPRRPANRGPATLVASARHTASEYAALIERCRDAIRAGDAYQLCLTTRFTVTASTAFDPVATYLALRSALPAHHGGFIRSGDTALLSASPERFLEVRDAVVRTRPIKGTRPRGHDDTEDEELRRQLQESVKERAENVMIVDLMRNDLQRVCVPGTVVTERLLEVESYSAVHQLVSTVAGNLVAETTLGDVCTAAFPAGSMTGAPKLSAMTILHALEAGSRGLYAGCFGWVGADGAADLAMTIRSVVLRPDGAYVGAGGGITWLSDAAEEVAEVGIKARGPLAALGVGLPPGW